MEGQIKLKNAKVLLIGTGGLGAPLGLYLTAAGVGTSTLNCFSVDIPLLLIAVILISFSPGLRERLK